MFNFNINYEFTKIQKMKFYKKIIFAYFKRGFFEGENEQKLNVTM